MISDRTRLSYPDALFLTDRTDPSTVNLAGGSEVMVRTPPPVAGEQWNVNGLRVDLQANDLTSLMSTRDKPFLAMRVVKEVSPGMFADPHSHRLHSIVGSEDLRHGLVDGARIIEVNGVPTVVSLGRGDCAWTSRAYRLPRPAKLVGVSWELASSALTPPDAFDYKLDVRTWAEGDDLDGAPTGSATVADGDAALPRSSPADLKDVRAFQLSFRARVRNDGAASEKHAPLLSESLGRPLLSAVHLLEEVESAFRIRSLHELLAISSDHRFFYDEKRRPTALLATIDLSAALAHSEHQDVNTEQYEFMELTVSPNIFSRVEARVDGESLVRGTRG